MRFIQRSIERGITKTAWLFSKHSFSFNSYQNPKRGKFGALLVVNEDTIAPGKGFSMHSHRDMEIVSLVLSGKLAHNDSAGNKGVLQPGEVQVMSAGTGIQHSELNGSKDYPVHFLQIWIEPGSSHLTPSYSSKTLKNTEQKNKLQVVCSGTGERSALLIHQDAKLLLGKLVAGSVHEYVTRTDRGVFCFIIKGSCLITGELVREGDSIEVYDEPLLTFQPREDTHLLVIDVPFAVSS
ncbi:pirin family protein [Candidatus Pacearchaeota archaeon]|nr:pirin family protein [Candidatus Pacearchaeota archaeon]